MGCGKNQRRTRPDPEADSGRLGRNRRLQPEENIPAVRKESLPLEVLQGFAKVLHSQSQRPSQARRRPNKYLCLNLWEIPAAQANGRSEERESLTEAGVSLSERAGIDASDRILEREELRPTLITESEGEIPAFVREKSAKSIELPFSLANGEAFAAEESVFPYISSNSKAEKARISPIQQILTDVQSPKNREGVITEASDHE